MKENGSKTAWRVQRREWMFQQQREFGMYYKDERKNIYRKGKIGE